jgi:hypothetical protein
VRAGYICTHISSWNALRADSVLPVLYDYISYWLYVRTYVGKSPVNTPSVTEKFIKHNTSVNPENVRDVIVITVGAYRGEYTYHQDTYRKVTTSGCK